MSVRSVCCVLALALLAVACGDDRSGHDGGGSGCDDIACESGVGIHLGNLLATYPRNGTLFLHACFDASCDDVTLSPDSSDQCGGKPGVGAPDQLTSCFVNADGTVEIDIARTDGADYSNGAQHVIAVSIKDASGNIVHQAAQPVVLSAVTANGPACGSVCDQANVDLGP